MDYRNRDRLLQLAESVLEAGQASEADQAEVVLTTGEDYLTRFAANRIHQNVGSRQAGATIRVVSDKRIGVAETEGLEPEALRDTLARAQEIAHYRPPLEDFKHLPSPGKIRPIAAFDQATADFSPDQRAGIVALLVAAAKRRRAEAAGLLQTQAGEILVANSRGVRAYQRMTGAKFQTVVTCGDGDGYAQSESFAVGDLDVKRVIRDGLPQPQTQTDRSRRV
ncbi:MAG: hypothetical protein GWP05_04790 [Anaerolineaceae bacterium]|nr:hypothetical protein [Anaerolineaceae bacterium]